MKELGNILVGQHSIAKIHDNVVNTMPSITDELPSLDGDVVGGLSDGGGLGGRLLLRGVLVVDGVVAVVGLGAGAEGVAVLEGGEAPGAPVVSHVDPLANLPLKSLLDAELHSLPSSLLLLLGWLLLLLKPVRSAADLAERIFQGEQIDRAKWRKPSTGSKIEECH